MRVYVNAHVCVTMGCSRYDDHGEAVHVFVQCAFIVGMENNPFSQSRMCLAVAPSYKVAGIANPRGISTRYSVVLSAYAVWDCFLP